MATRAMRIKAARKPKFMTRTVRVENFGFFAALIRIARVAMFSSCAYFAKGMPSSASSAFARSSRPAVVTIVTFRPFDLSVLA